MQPNSFSMTSETRGTSILPLLNLWVECMSPESGGPSAQQVRLTTRECAHISLNLQNNIYSGREDRKSQAFSTYFINTSIYVLFLFSSPLPLQPSDSLWISFSETTVCWLIQALGIWSIFFCFVFLCSHVHIFFQSINWTMQLFLLPSRFVLCLWWYIVSWNHGVLLASHPVQLSLDISQTRLLPLEKKTGDKAQK